ncbi:MAG: siderophore ABC transporter substrate-binding protein [Tissierellaceae bacterium]|nr:siderophore ABC transporter substrate-binding protein [Tissierellaceae bacterium]
MKNIRKILVLGIAMIAAFAMVACTSQADGEELNKGEESKNTITIEHELGKTTLEKQPERIVVFDYGILDALDKIDAQVVGLPKATLPNYLEKYKSEEYTDAGTLKEPNFETIFETNPDLIIISTRQVDLYEEFAAIAPTVYLTVDGGDYLGSFRNNMEVLGKIFDKEDFFAEEVQKIDDTVSALNEQASNMKETALFLMVNEGNLSVYGPGSRYGMLYNEFGLKPADEKIESGTHGQKVSFEYIVDVNPDYLFVMDRADVTGGESSSDILDNELIESTNAFKNGNINYLDAHIWYVSSGGITGTMRMVEQVQDALSK